jgi:hypothetical protein
MPKDEDITPIRRSPSGTLIAAGVPITLLDTAQAACGAEVSAVLRDLLDHIVARRAEQHIYMTDEELADLFIRFDHAKEASRVRVRRHIALAMNEARAVKP